ncbi:MAG: hypothetical protein NPIRA02_32940 [Nitrospirales bacterium]|nr:MAG: hypothetical protein NPIRA02_32940 [Nitrospirales bacterium]
MIQWLSTLYWLNSQLDNTFRALAYVLGPISFFFTIGLASLSLSPVITHAAENTTYIQELQQQAIDKHLFDQRYWHLLLHYKSNTLGGYTSEIDDPGFFMAESGKTDPKAELLATLRQFFSRDPVGRSEQPAQCALRGRYFWLKEKLHFDDERLHPLPCLRFASWINELNPDNISIIFPSAFMNNPASMFGHTFLRVDQKGQTEHTRILAYTINYAADVPQHAGIEYAWKGIFGGYKGFFSTIPYYMKVKEYRDLENRDIWEYRLNFSPKQIHRLLLHAWEMGNAYFDYFFFKENCAYHILSLLEIANPDIRLTDNFQFWTIPADTIRLLMKQEGLVEDIVYRPAHNTQIKRKQESLQGNEIALFHKVTSDTTVRTLPNLETLSPTRQAFLLDLTADYLRYRSRTEQDNVKDIKALTQKVLVRRSLLGIQSPQFTIKPFTTSPERGHETSRVGIGFGWREDELFEQFSIRGAYHDLLDPDTGYTRDAQIELVSLRLRHYEKQNQFRLERFTFANVLSLSPIDSLFTHPSWKLNLGMETIKTRDCDLCSNGNVNIGIGGAFETDVINREVYFMFAEGDANISGAFDDHHRIGPGVTGGVVTNLTDNWKALFSIGYFYYPLGEQSDDFRVSFGQRYTLSQNWALRTEFNHRDRDNEVMLRVQAFF